MTIEAMRQALEALENPWSAGPEGVADAIIALRAAIEQAGNDVIERPWVGLTYEEIAREFYKFDAAGGWYQFARAIEAQLKEKNEKT
jgi:hypothetical protein